LKTPGISTIAFLIILGFSLPLIAGFTFEPGNMARPDHNLFVGDSTDTLRFPITDPNQTGGLYLNRPSNFSFDTDFDEESGMYIVYERIGGLLARPPMFMTPEEYQDYIFAKQVAEYWNEKTGRTGADPNQADERSEMSSLIPQFQVGGEGFGRIFGSNIVDIRPQGTAELSFGGRYQKIDNPIIPERNRSVFNFDFQQRIQMNTTGKIGEKLNLQMNYDTEATFNFENRMKLEFSGEEDDIIKKLEMGNVSLPVNSSLITGAQSLMGIKGQFQFGKTTVTTVFSEQQSQSKSIDIQGGGARQQFEIWGDEYEANRHFFLSHYFRDNYEQFLRNMPLITSPVQITRVEVWVTNRRSASQDVRNIVAFSDLGEAENRAFRNADRNLGGEDIFTGYPGSGQQARNVFPNNNVNKLNPLDLVQSIPGVRNMADVNAVLVNAGFVEATEFVELANARMLTPNEYFFNPQLGYISLNQALNQDEVVAVAFQYVANGRTFQVGEFSNDGVSPPKNLIVKMLRSTILDVRIPMWDLMMKNVYSLNAFQVNPEDFRLDILYMNDETGVPIPFLPDGNLRNDLLIRVMDLDRVNQNLDPIPDGFFDFVPNITINPQNGRIIFPVVEPFGSHLARKLDTEEARQRYVFQELYDSTRFRAQEQTQLNKFLMRGEYKSASGAEISLNAFNIPRGSVSVTAGGQTLTENTDYTVDYSMGRVKILNEAILNSGMPIRVNFENNTLFNFQTKTFMGATFDHRVNQDFNVGGSILRLSERPLTQKVNIGQEPIANTIWGLNTQYNKDAPWLTRAVDKLPFISTKESSNISFQGEVAQLIPGSPRGIKLDGEETTYIDDFESSQTEIDIRGFSQWFLASTPAGQPDLFPEAAVNNQQEYGFNRAKLAWYVIDPVFHMQTGQTPSNIRDNKSLISNHYTRQVLINEIFPNIQIDPATPRNIAMFDLTYFPNERGPYNFDVEGVPGISAGLNQDGTLNNPRSRWAGIMRALQINNFEEQNIEFVQFWMMDPFLEDPTLQGGELYFNLGSVSEDVLKDGRQFFENGMSPTGDRSVVENTNWGTVPRVQPIVEAFDNDPQARQFQDIGLDGLSDAEEREWEVNGVTYLQRLEGQFGAGSAAYQQAFEDPAGDNFGYYRGDDLDGADAGILERYKNFNGTEGNSSTQQIQGFPVASTNLPDREDLNRDFTLSKTEAYYQYEISIRQNDLRVGHNYITDKVETQVELPDGTTKTAVWYQFKIPIFEPDKVVGPISDFRSIRFIRMFMRNFENPITLRFARMDLIRGEWRRYMFSLDDVREEMPIDEGDMTIFNVNAVNLEENGERVPIPYKLPPGIDRQIMFGTSSLLQQNEQSLSMYVCNLRDGDARAVFRNLNMDMRMYNRLRMFVHAEAGSSDEMLRDGDLNVFIRLGSDFNQNYYEYEIPMLVTEWGETSSTRIWPAENEFNFSFDIIKEVKLERDRAIANTDNITMQTRFSRQLNNGHRVTVIGAPNLSNVRTIMIGIRNPKKRAVNDGDDGLPKCAEVWVNELRLSDFDERGGWAANARLTAKLADFGNIAIVGNMSTVGFGALDMSVSERNQFELFSYDLQSNFEFGKFFPERAGLRIPVFFGIAEEWISPMFNPLDPDIEFRDALNNIENPGARDSLRFASQDYTRRRNFNVTNLRKERRGAPAPGKRPKKPMPWDVENFALSYSYSEIFRRSINTIYDIRTDQRGSLNYSFSTRPKPIEPFKNVAFIKNNKNLKLLKDFNFNYMPTRFTFRTEVNRLYNEAEQRNTSAYLFPGIEFPPLPVTYNKSFVINRIYDLNYDLTRALKIDYNARMNSWVDELQGPSDADSVRESIRESLRSFGRPTMYNQTINVNWTVPIDKLPLMDFVNLTARYSGNYEWRTNSTLALQAPPGPEGDSLRLGNTIQNSANLQLNANLNMVTLYNKVPFLKAANTEKKRPAAQQQPPQQAMATRRRGQEEEKKEEEEKPSIFKEILRHSARTAMALRSVSGTYSLTQGTMLPGYNPTPGFFGMNQEGGWAPGPGFVFGAQNPVEKNAPGGILSNPRDLRVQAGQEGWLTNSPLQNQPFSQTTQENLNVRATVEPLKDLRIEFSALRNQGENYSSFYRFDELNDVWRNTNEMFMGNYSISFLAIGTSFESISGPEYASQNYQNFRDNRVIVSERFANARAARDPGYTPAFNPQQDSSIFGYDGYSVTSTQVLVPAFIAAYSGQDINRVPLNGRPTIPLPNWTLNYSGLMKMDWFKKRFTNFTMSHGYRSTYTVGSFQTNMLLQSRLEDLQPGDPFPRDENGDFLPTEQMSQISITESFGPLIGFNVRTKGNTTFRVEYLKNRNILLSLANNQISETREDGITVGAGYIIRDVKLGFIKTGANRKAVVSNLELKADVSVRDNSTIIRRVFEDLTQVTAGQSVVSIKVSADYMINQRITAKLFYDQIISRFKTSNAFPTSNVNAGIMIRLNLGQ
jgi:cell surface protein SprA